MRSAVCRLSLTWLVLATAPLVGADPAFELGERLLGAGYFEEAITEYERFVCFGADSQRIAEACRRIGRAYRNLGMLEQASASLHRALAYATDDSLAGRIRIDIAVIALAMKAYDVAELELLKLARFNRCPEIVRTATFYLGVCYLYTGRWELAHGAFTGYFADTDASAVQRVETLLSSSNRPRLKSPSVGKWLSTFIPGSGQIYAGDIRNGVNAAAINAAFGYLFADAVVDGRYGDAIIAYYPLFERYYRGNRYHAETVARERNAQESAAYAERVMDAVSPP